MQAKTDGILGFEQQETPSGWWPFDTKKYG